MDTTTFAQKIKEKYPVYQDVDDNTLVAKIVEKYPVYKSQIKNKIGYSNTGQELAQTGRDIVGTVKETGQKIADAQRMSMSGEQSPLESGFQMAGAVSSGVSGLVGDVVKGGVQAVLPQEAENAVKAGIATGVQKASDVLSKYEQLKTQKPALAGAINLVLGSAPEATLGVIDLVKGYEKIKTTNPRLARNLDAALGIGELALDIGTLGGSKVAVTAGKEVVEQGAKAAGKQAAKVAGEVATQAGKAKGALTKTATETIDLAKKKLGTPEPTVEQAVGQVVQGKSTDVVKAQKAIQSIDTKDVKTYKDLANKLQEKKKELVKTVDSELDKDLTSYPIEQLATKATTKSGKEVTTNYVSKSLSDLKEYYRTVGDAVKESEVDDLIAKNAFTRKEVNDISRIYNEEFGTKAFGKTGEPLTSVNAQAYENTRKGLKDVARQGIGGNEAKLADESLSAIYNTEKLVKRNIEAVNKLQQRINERGLLEKAGNMVAKYGDILTGGTIRGLAGGLLPRGAGYKVLNALDLEEQLAKNLEIINKAMNAKSDDALVKAVKQLDVASKNK